MGLMQVCSSESSSEKKCTAGGTDKVLDLVIEGTDVKNELE